MSVITGVLGGGNYFFYFFSEKSALIIILIKIFDLKNGKIRKIDWRVLQLIPFRCCRRERGSF